MILCSLLLKCDNIFFILFYWMWIVIILLLFICLYPLIGMNICWKIVKNGNVKFILSVNDQWVKIYSIKIILFICNIKE